ncbi:Calpain-7 [Holothuria leucospilota]|uniref:Calpain-7 n=1 Tax=Holothuria leucospilota TaxID=206669 RepID=A0A9Q0YL80_HOLLE|nr:Calpain-7 [Holothuria leucospilota]
MYGSGSGQQDVPSSSLSATGQADALLRDAKEFAVLATEYDGMQQYQTALFYYVEAIQAIYNAALVNPELNLLSGKYTEYVQRVRNLQAHLKQGKTTVTRQPSKSEDQIKIERAHFLLTQAFNEDEEGNNEEAITLYLNAAELCINSGRTSSEPQKSKLNKLAKQALDRAETLKSQKKETSLPSLPEPPSSFPEEDTIPDLPLPPTGPLPSFDEDEDESPTSSNYSSNQSAASSRDLDAKPPRISQGGGGGPGGGVGGGGGGGGRYTEEEIKVLGRTSKINGREYVPFISKADRKERFAFPVPFTDKCGTLVLAPKQRERFGRWARPEEFCSDPQIVYVISSFSVRQTIIQDCSFLSSLAISANYERRFKKTLISSIIFPQDKKGKPVYNPCGKYMVILNINGVKRKVIIDDLLPLDKNGQLLCSFSSNRNELWVSLLEKAYLKVMGGYDFPGSNSNIDLHTLTGWIPERISIKPDAKDFDKDKTFMMLLKRFHKGDVLVTVATGPMSDADAERAGLVSTHAYAMLDIREIRGKRLMQLKNPWSHMRWKGNFSEFDLGNWTPELQKELNFDPHNAQEFDNGVFWIDFHSVCKFFDVLYLNWNPALFLQTYVLHSSWTATEGPKKDVITMGNNPQYRLEVKGHGAVWILLSRHITDKEDFADNKEFITLVLFKGGKKVFYPNDPPPFMDGTRINSPHYLCKLVVKEASLFTVVVSQFEKSNTIHYSLRVYSSCDFRFSKMPEPYKHTKSITGEWKGRTAGGCANHRQTFENNPIYQVNLQDTTRPNYFMVDLKGPKSFYVGFDIIAISTEGPGDSFEKKRSGEYRRGFSILQMENLRGGIYNIRPTTFDPGQESPFFLTLSSSCPMKVTHLQ